MTPKFWRVKREFKNSYFHVGRGVWVEKAEATTFESKDAALDVARMLRRQVSHYRIFVAGVIPAMRECPVHDLKVHGKEAEELRSGVEEIIKTCRPCTSTREDGCTGCHIVEELQVLLDRVDARDSLAYRERKCVMSEDQKSPRSSDATSSDREPDVVVGCKCATCGEVLEGAWFARWGEQFCSIPCEQRWEREARSNHIIADEPRSNEASPVRSADGRWICGTCKGSGKAVENPNGFAIAAWCKPCGGDGTVRDESKALRGPRTQDAVYTFQETDLAVCQSKSHKVDLGISPPYCFDCALDPDRIAAVVKMRRANEADAAEGSEYDLSEAYELAALRREKSNLARAYLALCESTGHVWENGQLILRPRLDNPTVDIGERAAVLIKIQQAIDWHAEAGRHPEYDRKLIVGELRVLLREIQAGEHRTDYPKATECGADITDRNDEHRQSVCLLVKGHPESHYDPRTETSWTDAEHYTGSPDRREVKS